MAFPSSIWRTQLALEVSLESDGLRCWCVILVYDFHGWLSSIVGGVRVPFVMNSWILFCCTGFFCFFLVIPDGLEPLWSGSPLRDVSITNEDAQILSPRQKFNRLKANVNRHCVFCSNSIQPIFLFFVFFFWNPIPSTKVKL